VVRPDAGQRAARTGRAGADRGPARGDGLSRELQFRSWLPTRWPEVAAWLAGKADGAAPARTAALDPSGLRPLPDLAFAQDWRIGVRSFTDLARITEEAAAVAPHLRVGAAAAESFGHCLGWTRRINNPQRRLRTGTRRPILVVAARHDGATPHR